MGSLLSNEIVCRNLVYEIAKALLLWLKQGGGPGTEGVWDRKVLEAGLSVTYHSQEALVMFSWIIPLSVHRPN